MQDRPTAEELLLAIERLLDDQVLPATTGPLRHQVRVAANLCRIVRREWTLGPAQETRQVDLLSALLGDADDTSAPALHAILAERILARDAGEPPRDASRETLLEIVREKLAIAKPGYADFDFEEELRV